MAENILWYGLSWQEAVKRLDSNNETGLSEKEVLERREKFGRNKLPEDKPLSGIGIFLEQFRSPLIYILFTAGIVVLFFREWVDAAVIFGAVFLNTVVGFLQENKANQALSALKRMVKIEAHILRGGEEKRINSEDLAPGDIIILTAGDKVPADARLIYAHHLMVQEAALTGEWLANRKTTDVLPEDTPVADRENMVYAGSVVESGKGEAVVTATGLGTEIGGVASMVRRAKEVKTPLQNKIAKFSMVVGLTIAVIVSLIFVQGILKGMDSLEMFMTSIAVAVAAIPEGLPIAMTVILALGMQRILKRKGLVRKLAAAEVLGSTSVIVADKTLTLTQGKMKAVEIFTEDRNLLFKIVSLTSEPLGSPTDKALLLAAEEAGIRRSELEKYYVKIDEIPFNPQNKFVALLLQEAEAEREQLIFVSGAPEKIINHSVIDAEASARLNSKLRDLTNSGFRVVAAAYKKIANHKTEIANLKEEINGLTFVGFIALNDPLRPEAKEAINLCRKAGIKPVIVTGDHLLTAKAVAKELGLGTGDKNIIEGKDLDAMSDKELGERVKNIEIYARVEPRHKLRIVEAWQGRGQVVAMTGDGINDAPALKQADIGVALGSGTDVAKEGSDLILLTDSFNVLVFAVEEGRAIIDNIRKVITYLLSDSFTETILIGASVIFGWPLPITAAQILWINLVEDGLPNIALAFEPKEDDVLNRKPEAKNIHLLTRGMKVIIFAIGILTDFLLLGILWQFLGGDYDLQYIRTIIFAALGIDSLFYIFSCKNLRKNIWRINPLSNKLLIVSVIFGFAAIAGAIYIPLFQALLKTVPLGLGEWLLVIALGVVNILLIELAKYIFIIRGKSKI